MQRVYTDGSTDSNGNASATGGIGVYFGDDRDMSEPYDEQARVLYGPATNQKCELLAIARALENVHEPVCIVTDSKYSIGCLTDWYPNWVRNGWKNSQGKPVKNKGAHSAQLQAWRTLVRSLSTRRDMLGCTIRVPMRRGIDMRTLLRMRGEQTRHLYLPQQVFSVRCRTGTHHGWSLVWTRWAGVV